MNKIIIILSILLLFIINSCDTTEPPITNEYQSKDEAPSWSHDGNWIAYHHFNYSPDDASYPTGLYIIDTSGNNRKLILAGPAYNPAWSPNDSIIAFDLGNIFTLHIYTGELNQLTFGEGQHFPQWSSDGKNITFSDGINTPPDTAGIWIINTKTFGMKYLWPGLAPDWSPDNSSLVYESFEGITIGKIEGNIFKTILPSKGGVRYPRWSPNGSTIAYTVNNAIWLMNTNGGNQQELIKNSFFPCWSPDSKKITFQKQNAEKNKLVIWIINVDGSGLKQITN
jgi:Tol biopolymer transport system component